MPQANLFPSVGNEKNNLPDIFKKLYYHLYTNSKASRAEAIVEDLSLLLLLKLAAEVNGGKESLDQFLSGEGKANKILLPILLSSYPSLVHDNQRFALGDEALRKALLELKPISLSNAPAHALGEAFQALIGPRLRGEKGQFFTPGSLVKAMITVVDPKPGERVLDPACGTGGFLYEAYAFVAQKHVNFSMQLVGVDKDNGLSRLASALLKVASKGSADVFSFNSLDNNQWLTETREHYEGKFDVVLTNPPFGSKIGVSDQNILKDYDFGFTWVLDANSKMWRKTNILVQSQDPQILFLEMCVRAVKPGGRVAIVLPEGLFGNKQTSYIWQWLEQRGHVSALLDCPRTTFQPGTDTKTNVLFFTKAGDGISALRTTKVAVALHCGHDRRGRMFRADGSRYPDDFGALSADYHGKCEDWKDLDLAGKKYLVPRYFYEDYEIPQWERELTKGAEQYSIKSLISKGLITIRKGHEVGSEAYGTGDIPFVRTSDISNFEISSDPTKSISSEIYERYASQQKLVEGDILIVVDGRYRIGTTAILSSNNFKCVVQSHLRIIGTPNREELDPYQLLFALNLPSVRLRMRNLVFIQSTLGTLGNRLQELKLPLLVGEGPWAEATASFRSKLVERDRILAELRSITSTEVEL